MRTSSFGHAATLNQPSAPLLEGFCLRPHPLVAHVACQRLRGHPGKHGSSVDARSVEVVMQWEEKEQALP